jgi:hypothetical protein
MGVRHVAEVEEQKMARQNAFVIGFTIFLMALSASGQPASAGETIDEPRMALIFSNNPELTANPAIQHVAGNLCGITLGGYCPGGYRACLRSGTPQAECNRILARCNACNDAMLHCREKVGHVPGYTCVKCRKALFRCRAHMSHSRDP